MLAGLPRPVPLQALPPAAVRRWRIEENFQVAKGLTGLDQPQVRKWTALHRWTTPAMFAHAFLAVATAIERDRPQPTPSGVIAMFVNGFRRLYDAIQLGASSTVDNLLAWSHWRRRHQAQARECHYRRRGDYQ